MPIIEIHGKRPVIHESCYIAPNAAIIGDVRIKADSSVWFNAVLRGDQASIEIGEGTSIQDGVIIHPDRRSAIIGDHVTIGHGAFIEGVYIEDEVLIGIGAIVLEGARIGRGSLIGAGTLVTRDTVIKPGRLVMGVPGREVGEVSPHHTRMINESWRTYVDHKNAYKYYSRIIKP